MRIVLLLIAAGLAGCGLDIASSAATAGSIKKREIEQAQKTMQNAQQKLDASMQQVHAREPADSNQEP
jgi:NifU-like protein involved in Fe-S cluster formation